MDLSKMMRLVRRRWPWIVERYPEMPAPGPARKRFQRHHLLWHMMKQLGRLTAIEERLDHDPAGADPARNDALVKLLINVMHFAMVEGLTPARLSAALEKYFDTTPV